MKMHVRLGMGSVAAGVGLVLAAHATELDLVCEKRGSWTFADFAEAATVRAYDAVGRLVSTASAKAGLVRLPCPSGGYLEILR